MFVLVIGHFWGEIVQFGTEIDLGYLDKAVEAARLAGELVEKVGVEFEVVEQVEVCEKN